MARIARGLAGCFLRQSFGSGDLDSVGKASPELDEVLRGLVSARDEARLKAHLLSMDTRRRLGDLELEIENFERKLAARGDWVTEHVIAAARGLTLALTAFNLAYALFEVLRSM